VHTLPSLQFTGGWPHCPVAGSHRSWVQESPSAQSCALPMQVSEPPLGVRQVSPEVQASWSSHGLPRGSGVPTHCPEALQVSDSVQALPSSQGPPGRRGVPTHRPELWQLSATVHGSPSLQAVPAGRIA
jgi:hypothetical protein